MVVVPDILNEIDDFIESAYVKTRDFSLSALWHTLKPLKINAFSPENGHVIDSKLPTSWGREELSFHTRSGKQTADVYIAPVKNPVGIVAYSLGWKTHPLERRATVSSFQNEGYSVYLLGLKDPGRDTGTLDDDTEMLKSFFFCDDSPVHDSQHSLPRFIITHSTSGMLYQHAVREAYRENGKIPHYRHAIHTCPFFDTSLSSALFYPLRHKLYNRHAVRNGNEYAGSLLADRLYYYFKGISGRLRHEDPTKLPTHGQILEICAYALGYLNKKRNGEPEQISYIPQTFVISSDDSFSCPHTAKHVARLEGAHVVMCEADHNPLQIPHVRQDIIQRLNSMALNNNGAGPQSEYFFETADSQLQTYYLR